MGKKYRPEVHLQSLNGAFANAVAFV